MGKEKSGMRQGFHLSTLFFFFFLAVLEFELRTLCLHTGALSLESLCWPFSTLVIFGIGSHFFAQASLDSDPLIYASHHFWHGKHVTTSSFFFLLFHFPLRWGPMNIAFFFFFFAWDGLEP
jgi:hypothetical protein